MCGTKSSRFVCSSCGRRTCENCIDLKAWACRQCSEEIDRRRGQELDAGLTGVRVAPIPQILFVFGLAAVLLGFLIILAAGVLAGGEISAGGVVFIGPIPIVFGSGGDPALIALVSLLALATMIAAIYFLYVRRRT